MHDAEEIEQRIRLLALNALLDAVRCVPSGDMEQVLPSLVSTEALANEAEVRCLKVLQSVHPKRRAA
ncbi:hypothetical protein [Uliginosibacterium gangwonense]|uniref:hypothetical protein n=1 Tax=Uliginosibacterium gangwonense TaxID=392736 RepID=UPI0012F7F8A6|nr:hypothetical protein [Uliginosibacterium gangwonense]